MEKIVCAGNEAAVVLRIQVDVYVAGEGSILIADHGRPSGERNLGYFIDGNLRAGRCSDENSSKFLDVVSKVAVVTDIDRISFAALDVFGHHFAADSESDGLLHIRNCKPITRCFGPID